MHGKHVLYSQAGAGSNVTHCDHGGSCFAATSGLAIQPFLDLQIPGCCGYQRVVFFAA